MKLAIVGSRGIKNINLKYYIPSGIDEIVSGGAIGIDSLAREFALSNNIKLTEFLPIYKLYGRAAPLVRNREIAKYADEALVFWDGKSKGTKYTIELFEAMGKKATVIRM